MSANCATQSHTYIQGCAIVMHVYKWPVTYDQIFQVYTTFELSAV